MDKNGELKKEHSPCCVCGGPAVTIGTNRRAYCSAHANASVAVPVQDGIDKAAAMMTGDEK